MDYSPKFKKVAWTLKTTLQHFLTQNLSLRGVRNGSPLEIRINCTTACSCLPRFSGIYRKSNPKLRSTVPKTLFWITSQTSKRGVGSVRKEIYTFPDSRARTVWLLCRYPWVARSKDLLSFNGAFVRDRLPRVILVYPLSGMRPEKDGESLPKLDLYWKSKLPPYTLQYS